MGHNLQELRAVGGVLQRPESASSSTEWALALCVRGEFDAVEAGDLCTEADGQPVPAVDRDDGEGQGRDLLGREDRFESAEIGLGRACA